MKKNRISIVVMLIALLPLAYLAVIWNSLPQVVPVHFNYKMEPDRMGSRSELWVAGGIITVVSMLVYLLLTNIHRIDPKRKNQDQSTTFTKLALGLVIFMAALNGMIISSAKGTTTIRNLILPLIGLLFAFMGNYMISLKPNYFAGFRLPWTLSSDENWRRTHQLGGKLWFAGGILIAVACLFIPAPASFYLFLVILGVMVIVPAFYSYSLFKKQV
ncbi:MAG TPA: SdpI family protein [Flavisolibacter sp.]|jgi:uncharacterized membrane protein|nr:SdpI family protein [Flavisolibacter sp.]